MYKFKIVSDVKTFNISDADSVFRDNVTSYFNRYNQFEFVSLDDIAIGEKYIVFLSYYKDFICKSSIDNRNYYNFVLSDLQKMKMSTDDIKFLMVYTMPARIWDDSGNGLVKWIICDHTEPFTIDKQFKVDGLIRALNTKPENIIYMTGSVLDTEFNSIKKYTFDSYNIETLHWNTLKSFIDIGNRDMYFNIVNERVYNIKNKKILPYKSICYNRLPRSHRIIIVSHMIYNKDLYRDCNYSLGINLAPDAYQSQLIYSLFIHHADLLYLIPTCKHVCSLTDNIKIYNEDDINLFENQAHVINQTHALDTSFQIVTETCSYNGTQYITEKSYKPFIMMQPFIQYGNYKNINVLRDLGYKTFDKWIDHSYDDIENDADRMIAFLKEMDRLQSISKETWADMLYDMQDDLMHNLSLVSAQEFTTPMTKLTSILLDFYQA